MSLKKFIYLAGMLLLLEIPVQSIHAQFLEWQWAESAGNVGADFGNSVATDTDGNVYVAGTYNSHPITFGVGQPLTLGETTLSNSGGNDIFLIKFSPIGNVLWAKKAGGAANDDAYSITVDIDGNIYLSGMFQSPSISFGATTLSRTASVAMFLAKFDAAGNELWAKSVDGAWGGSANAVSTDATGNVIVTGNFSEPTVTFGSTTLTLTMAGGTNMYVVKFTSTGTVLWAKNAGGVTAGANSTIGNSVVTDDQDNIYVAGQFTSTSITFDALTLTNTNAPANAMFLVKYDASGMAVWAKQSTGGNAVGKGIELDENGNIYITGWIFNTVSFGSLSLTSLGLADAFLIKYNAMGNEVWANRYGSAQGDYGLSITLDASNGIYTTGYFNGTVDFDAGLNVNELTSAGNGDIYILKSNNSGNYLWSQSMGGTLNDRGDALTVSNLGIIYVTGIFAGTCDFDPGATTYTLVSLGFSDIFISRLGACPNSEKPTITFNNSNPDAPVLISSSPNGNQWFNNFTIIPGANNKSYLITEPGLYTVQYTTAGCASPMSEVYTIVGKSHQTISFDPLTDKTLGDAVFTLTATASSNLEVNFFTVSDKINIIGKQVTLTKAGRVTVTAAQAGDVNYNAAPSVVRSFCIKPTKPAITAAFINPEAPILTATNDTGNQWYFNDVAIAGATNKTLTISSEGSYKVNSTVDDCQSLFSDALAIVVTGIGESSLADIHVYPNPVQDYLVVSGISEHSKSNVLNLAGSYQTIRQARRDGNLILDIRDLAAGTYLLQIMESSQIKMVRFIKNTLR